MNQNVNMDNVVRLITLGEAAAVRRKINHTDDKVIRIDVKKGEILHKKPLLGVRRHVRYYWVSPRNRAESGTKVMVKDFSANLSTTIKISYEVKCEKGNEEKVVLSLYKGDNPTEVLNRLLQSLVQDFAAKKRKNGGNPVLEYFQYREELKNHLVEKVREKVGLEIEIVLALEHEEELNTFIVKTGDFPVRVKDYDEEMNLKFEAGLKVSEENRIYAILNYSKLNELEAYMRNQIKKFTLENVSLHEFVYDLHNAYRKKLIGMLDQRLENRGREIAWIKLESKVDETFPQKSLNLHHKVQCDIKDYTKPIEVEHRLLMQLEDVGKYRAKQGDKKLKEWVEEKLNEITRNALFEKRYVEILLDFEKEESHREALELIKHEMLRFTETIGYRVKHLIVEPNMKPLIIKRDGFIVQKAGDFSTLNKRVNVKLDIVVTGKINDLSKIPQYITPDKDIILEMEQVIYNEGEKQMHNVDPQKFYMPFKYPDEEPIENILKTAIEKRLQEVFFAEDVTVIIKRMESDILQRILNLINGNPYQIDIEVLPFRGGGTQETIIFVVEFLVKTVSDWNTFIYKNFESHEQEIARIKQALIDDIAGKFQTIPFEVLKYTSYDHSRKLLEVARKSQGKISGIFGLEINLTDVKRKSTMIEAAQQEILEKKVGVQKEQEIDIIEKEKKVNIEKVDKLQELSLKYLDPEFSDEEPQDFAEQELEKIKNKAKETSINGKEAFKLPAVPSSREWSPDEYVDEFEGKSGRKTLSPGENEDRQQPGINREEAVDNS
ncbi:MAG: hypothetical protein PVH61_12315 [Candidatus Aminicenantes bacterium]|jgi:hypothetical protein